MNRPVSVVLKVAKSGVFINWTTELHQLVILIFIKLFYSLQEDFLIKIYFLEQFNFRPIVTMIYSVLVGGGVGQLFENPLLK